MDLAISKTGVKIKIANIQFQIISGKTKGKKCYEQLLLNHDLIKNKIFGQDIYRDKEFCISRNSFIPKTNIRTRPLYETSRDLLNKPLHPADLTYSKFPIRKSKPKRRRTSATPICRQKIFSFGNTQITDKLNTINSFQADKKMRTSAKSCCPFKGNDSLRQNFMRYSNINFTNSELKRRGVKTTININIEDKDIVQL